MIIDQITQAMLDAGIREYTDAFDYPCTEDGEKCMRRFLVDVYRAMRGAEETAKNTGDSE